MINKVVTSKRKLTGSEQRDLDLEIRFMTGLTTKDPEFVEAWRVLATDHASLGKTTEARVALEKLTALEPHNPCTLYDLACAYSLEREVDFGVAALIKAIARGFDDFKWLLKDPDLGNLRKDPKFKKVWERLSVAK